ncbi:MAG TPA: hypothetical protein VH594_15860 [Trebonia sp.]
MSELSMETPDEDAVEQSTAVPEEDGEERTELPFETDEADAAEQIRDAGYDDDDEDYR